MSKVQEGSAANFKISFFDEADAAVVPNAGTIFYSLRDKNGDVVGGLLDIAITPEAAIVYVSIDGLNNMIDDNLEVRCLRVVAEYNSSTYGTDREITMQYQYTIVDHKGVPAA